MKQFHEIQHMILQKLRTSRVLTFSAMKDKRLPSNQLSFHLDQLQLSGHIKKEAPGYALTDKGKYMTTYLEMRQDGVGYHAQAKLAVLLCCTRTVGSVTEVLITTRRNHPFFGRQGLLSGKILRGESPVFAGSRILHEKAGLQASTKVVQLLHYTEYQKDSQKLLEDKYLFLLHATVSDTNDDLDGAEELCERVPLDQLASYIKHPFRSVEETVRLITLCLHAASQADRFEEKRRETERF